MDEKEKRAIKYAEDLRSLYKYGTPLKFGEDENVMLGILLDLIKKLQIKPDCTDKEWMTCRVEKRGCEGCHYYQEAKKKAVNNVYGIKRDM